MADDNLITRESLRTAAVVAWQDGGNLQCAGFALHAIADLLGADGCEHYLTEKEKRGLLHAVHAIGTAVSFGALRIAEAGELAGGSEASSEVNYA